MPSYRSTLRRRPHTVRQPAGTPPPPSVSGIIKQCRNSQIYVEEIHKSRHQDDSRTTHRGDAKAHPHRAQRRRVDQGEGPGTHQGMVTYATTLAPISRRCPHHDVSPRM
ncbi:unnamed protein product [Macrosiphum euphorbiae]|uniref:Uncharacterized protein n=1 Tax=Macrosiphum euphorbiae TaxID=13131 RepID=A0AAV0VIK6_9HEMI|nr:unnamed protein product [Macrosiphum euphorbiae]